LRNDYKRFNLFICFPDAGAREGDEEDDQSRQYSRSEDDSVVEMASGGRISTGGRQTAANTGASKEQSGADTIPVPESFKL
jgi:hypothetical protein